MRKLPLVAAALLAAVATAPAMADDAGAAGKPITLAVFGDWPYSQVLLDNANRLIDSVNSDAAVSRVLFVGDIHSGSMPCTSAGILPPIAASNPGFNQKIFSLFQQFEAPLVYTPGDNEWTDCHKSKEKSAGDPLKELASVRSLFFTRPGRTLGINDSFVDTQALAFDPAYPSDATYVENAMWEESRVIFVTLNIPGSNDDTLPWTGAFANPGAQAAEVAARDAANSRWLTAAFGRAARVNAQAVVIGIQADMWDPAAAAPGGDGLSAYTPFVRQLADLALKFGRPVLLINGDSHLYGTDHPLADPNSASGQVHGTPAVPNLSRITVQGSTNGPAEWLRLTIDPRKREVFSFSNVAYCRDPSTSCD